MATDINVLLIKNGGDSMHFGSLLSIWGVNNWQTMVQLTVIGGGLAAYTVLRFQGEIEKKELEKLAEENKTIDIIKKSIANKDWSEEAEEEKAKINQEYEKLQCQKKVDEIEAANIAIEKIDFRLEYKGIPVPNKKALLLGFRKDKSPVWGYEVNYIIAGTTRMGKTRKLHSLLLNFLANHQGDVFIVDLKKTDYVCYDGINHVKCRVTELKDVAQAVFAFKEEYERRLKLIAEGYTDEKGIHRPYFDIEDYNEINPDKPLRNFMLLIDEFADISDCYTIKGTPTGCYAEIIELARKCGAIGGRIVMGTQRPSKDVIIGTLKNNCSLIGLTCLNETNSRIVIDTGGCEKLSRTEALGYVDTKLTKIYAYTISNKKILECTDRLKGIKIEPLNQTVPN